MGEGGEIRSRDGWEEASGARDLGAHGKLDAGGAREAESRLLVDGVATFKRPERTGVQRGKTFGRNFLPKERKAGEKEAGRDLKCLSNFQNTPNTPSGDEVSRG